MLMRSEITDESRANDNRTRFLDVDFDCLNQAETIVLMGQCQTDDRFGYVVTPNVDHIVRLAAQPAALVHYQKAWLCLCDSKPVEALSHTVGRPLTHVTGSDLTAAIFERVLAPGDVVDLVVARGEIADKLAELHPEVTFHRHVPPYGLMDKPDAMQETVNFLVDHPARFSFIAIGSPQSEVIAAKVLEHGGAHGTALCVGASLEFITGDRARAPAWMNHSGMEWLHRIAVEPRRLWKRYVFSIAPLVRLYWKELRTRQQA